MIGSEQLWKRGITLATTVALAGLAIGGFVGCADDDEENPRSVTSIVSVNDNLPLAADVYNLGSDKQFGGGDDYVPEDYLPEQLVGTKLYTPTQSGYEAEIAARLAEWEARRKT